MRAYDLAIYTMCVNVAIIVFSLTFSLAGADTDCTSLTDNPGCKLVMALPEDMRIIDTIGQVDQEGRTWNESIDYYAHYNYSQQVESEAEAQTSAWGDVLRGLSVFVGIIKMGVFGIFIMVNALLREAGMATGTRYTIALMFQTGAYAVYGMGLAQYIRGSGVKGYE